MGEFSRQVLELTHQLVARKAAEQGGVISGSNPASYNANDPFQLWVIQVVIIIITTQFLSLLLGRIRQPRVIAEVIGGIILGPTVMGRIPGFRSRIFPEAGMPLLNLTATIGLILFLFLVGLEIDTRVMKRNVLAATSISVAGLLIPLGLGAALGVGIYREFISSTVNFGHFLLFTAVAIGITAFPVLCRILTELKLLDTTVGIVTLAAGVGNDVVGWILLALTVALVNASGGLTALYVLLACVGFVLFLLYPVRLVFVWLARRTGSLEQGTPTALMMTITILLVFSSAFFTDIIGVHAIFGGFLAGLIIPHENGFAISLVEKIEDLVSILFLPIYFTLSGLRTNLGTMDNGITWGYTIIICLVAFGSKFFSCFAAARATGFNWREAGAIGSLMSCKGLVELIVLNIGLQANILDTRTFSMFVVHALILTFITTPLTLLFYPPKYRVDTSSVQPTADGETPLSRPSSDSVMKTRFALLLDKMEQLPAAMTIAQLLQPNKTSSQTSTLTSLDAQSQSEKALSASPQPVTQSRISIHALRLIELTTRTSAVLRSQSADSLIYNDPVVSIFRTFGYLNHLLVSAALSVVNYEEFPSSISRHVIESNSQMLILPWPRGTTSVEGEQQTQSGVLRVFDNGTQKTTTQDQTGSVVYSEFIRRVFATSPTNVALFVDRGLGSHHPDVDQHLFMPFFGGPDDRLALSFLIQLCGNPSVHATVIRITKLDELAPVSTVDLKEMRPISPSAAITHQTITAADTVYGNQNTQTRMASATADNIMWERYTSSSSPHDAMTTLALRRIKFLTVSSSKALHTVVELVNAELSHSQNTIVVAGRSRRMAVESHERELQQIVFETGNAIGHSVSKTLGDVGAALTTSGSNASLLILQSVSSSS